MFLGILLWLVLIVWCSIFLMAFCTSLEGQTVSSLAVYATSAFSKHSLISTVLVVQNVVNGEIEINKKKKRVGIYC
jgi:hypothetical protein